MKMEKKLIRMKVFLKDKLIYETKSLNGKKNGKGK